MGRYVIDYTFVRRWFSLKKYTGLFKSSEFARLSGVTKRTLRHYDEIGLLVPACKNDSSHRLYSEDDLKKMRQISILKFIGLSITDINGLLNEKHAISELLKRQDERMLKKMKQISCIRKAIKEIETTTNTCCDVNWDKLYDIVRKIKMEQYYSSRVKEYDSIYFRNDDTRQDEQNKIKELMKTLFAHKNVLEIACGTGYWTEVITETANTVTATDISDEMLAECMSRLSLNDNVRFDKADAFSLDNLRDGFNAGCANFWFSHIPKSKIDGFLESLNRKLGSGAMVFMADNMYIPGIGGELVAKPDEKDTYKIRELSNGEKYEVLKNYYNEDDLRSLFTKYSKNLNIVIGRCFWWLWYEVQ